MQTSGRTDKLIRFLAYLLGRWIDKMIITQDIDHGGLKY